MRCSEPGRADANDRCAIADSRAGRVAEPGSLGRLALMQKKLIDLLVVAVLALVIVGCHRPTEQEILGAYTHTFGNVTDKIFLGTNGIFRQEIKYTDGRVWNLTNTWTFTNLAICLDQSYMAYDEEKQLVRSSPQLVYMCTFLWEANALSRWDGHIVWVKSSLP